MNSLTIIVAIFAILSVGKNQAYVLFDGGKKSLLHSFGFLYSEAINHDLMNTRQHMVSTRNDILSR